MNLFIFVFIERFMKQIMRVVLLTISLVALTSMAACSSDEILATDFDQSCAVDADCAAVLVGDMCSCSCSSGAINKRDLAAYSERQAERTCSISCAACPELEPAVCKAGTCSVE